VPHFARLATPPKIRFTAVPSRFVVMPTQHHTTPGKLGIVVVHADVEEKLLRFLRSHLDDQTLNCLVPPRRFSQGMLSDVRSFTLNGGPKEWTGSLVLGGHELATQNPQTASLKSFM
jgi:hypothetical protein